MSNTLTSFSNNYRNIINIAKLSLLVGNINSYKLNTEEFNKKLNPYIKRWEDTFRCQIVNNIKSLYSLINLYFYKKCIFNVKIILNIFKVYNKYVSKENK